MDRLGNGKLQYNRFPAFFSYPAHPNILLFFCPVLYYSIDDYPSRVTSGMTLQSFLIEKYLGKRNN